VHVLWRRDIVFSDDANDHSGDAAVDAEGAHDVVIP